jgi:hypothetical protein
MSMICIAWNNHKYHAIREHFSLKLFQAHVSHVLHSWLQPKDTIKLWMFEPPLDIFKFVLSYDYKE